MRVLPPYKTLWERQKFQRMKDITELLKNYRGTKELAAESVHYERISMSKSINMPYPIVKLNVYIRKNLRGRIL